MDQDEVSKLAAARRQLDTAIKLFFDNEDGFAVYTLAYAAFKILFDIYPVHKNDGFADKIDEMIRKHGWQRFNRTANFLKHADRDPHDLLKDHSAEDAQGIIGFASIMYRRLAGDFSPQMRGFDLWTESLHPEAFNIPPDDDPEQEAREQKARDIINSAPSAERLLMGKIMTEALAKVWTGRETPGLESRVETELKKALDENRKEQPPSIAKEDQDSGK